MNPLLVRKASPSDQAVLWEMLYHSLFVPEGHEPFPESIVNRPDLARYVKAWGQPGDLAFIAIRLDTGAAIGATWLRLLKSGCKGYCYVDDETPEVGIALLPEFRGQGVGTRLFEHLFQEAESVYSSVSLSVSKENPAIGLYEHLGFNRWRENEDSVTMVKKLV